ncbi:MAG: EthD domain-containing protein [Pseudomonadota bacterium]
MTTDEFRAYYEDHHRVIGEKYLAGFASRYLRRYLNTVPDASGIHHEPEFDVLLEMWFDDDVSFQSCIEKLNEPAVAEEIAIDEEKLFDRLTKRSYIVEEHESSMRA